MAELSDFIHLRVHSGYSLLEGAIKVNDLLKLCAENNMPAVAITDTANLFCGVDFSFNAKDAGIQPILGCQVYFQKRAKNIYEKEKQQDPTQLVLLVQNEHGYKNLIKLISTSYLKMDPYARYPLVFNDELELHNGGLIAFTGGPKGQIGRCLLNGNKEQAEEELLWLNDVFKDRLYMEIMRHGMEDEMITEPGFLELAYKHDIPLVATNEVFFKDRGFYEAHDALICIAEKRLIAEDDRRKLTEEHYFKSAEEMKQIFSDLPEAINNTVKIAKRCGYMIEGSKVLFPHYTADDMGDLTEAGLMRKRAIDGLAERIKKVPYADEKEYRKRLDYEMDVIQNMGFCGYFLIVSDFIMYSKRNGIPVGPGRGSGAGSLVAWSLGITDLDPIKYGLLFERFLNPERVSMPDFDIDFCQEKREQTIKYVQDKYGYEKVAQIITYGKLQAKAVIRDVGRVLQVPFPVVDRFCKKIPNRNPQNPNKPVTLELARELEPEIGKMINSDRQIKKMFELGKQLEGLYRNASTHAAGVVIGPRDLDEMLPLYKDISSPTPVTQFDMKWVESTGLIKFDFLGLKTLTIIAKTVEMIEKDHGIKIDISDVPTDEKKAYQLLHRAETSGVFQLESSGMRDVLRQIKPDTIEEITAIVSLYRPGPMGNIPSYINRKFGRERIVSIHPLLDDLLKETYGIIVYQEQVMEIAKILAGYSLGGADMLRRAMGKKKKEEMDAQKEIFIKGATANGVSEEKAVEVFELMAKFAEYGFNKSHAAAYALIAYQTAYLKALYPREFMAATMTLDMHNTDKLGEFKQETMKMGIEIMPPDVNRSQVDFCVENGKIRYALAAIKNVGAAAMQALIDEREANGLFKSLSDFITRIDPHKVNRKCLENMAKSGCFDSLDSNRNKIMSNVDLMISEGNKAMENRESKQIDLFGSLAGNTEIRFAEVDDWGQIDRLNFEKDAIGFYLSSHPLDNMDRVLKKLKAVAVKDLERAFQSKGEGIYYVAGVLADVKTKISKSGKPIAFINFSDKTGGMEVICFSDLYDRHREKLVPGASFLFTLRMDKKVEDDGIRMTMYDIEELQQKKSELHPQVEIKAGDGVDIGKIKDIIGVLSPGNNEIYLILKGAGANVEILLGRYDAPKDLCYRLKSVKGVVDVQEC